MNCTVFYELHTCKYKDSLYNYSTNLGLSAQKYILCNIKLVDLFNSYTHSPSQEQTTLIKEAVDAMAGDTPPMFDPLGEGVDLSELAAASVAESAIDSGAGRRSTVRGWCGDHVIEQLHSVQRVR